MPKHSTQVTLEGLFTCEGDSHARCPVTTWALIHGNREYTVHYSHFIPKSEQSSLVAIELDDNVSNIMPTVEIIHTNMELFQRTPNLSFKFHGSLNNQYDQYTVVLNSGLSMNHALRAAVGSRSTIVLPVGSRPFVDVHYRVFCAHHGLNWSASPRVAVAPNIAWFDQVQADLLFGLTMMASPFVREVKKTAPRTSKFAPPSDAKVNSYPERYLSPAAAQKLVHTHIQVSSELFPQWAVEPHMCNAFVVAHSGSKRTFELMFPDDYPHADFELFERQGFKIRDNLPAIDIYDRISESTLLRYLDVRQHLDLKTCFKRRLRSEGSGATPRKSAGMPSRSGIRPSDPVSQKPQSIACGTQIQVLFTTKWMDGIITNGAGSMLTVAFDDGEELPFNFESKKAFKLLAKPLDEPTIGSRPLDPSDGSWMCVDCAVWHHHLDVAPECKDKICCSKCRVPMSSIGVSYPQRGGRLRAQATAVADPANGTAPVASAVGADAPARQAPSRDSLVMELSVSEEADDAQKEGQQEDLSDCDVMEFEDDEIDEVCSGT
jgi:hypothetical protein